MIELKINNINIEYGNEKVIDNVSAIFTGGNMIAIIGKNGAGKTSLIRAIAGLVKHKGGVELLEEKKSIPTKGSIAYVPQLGELSTKLTVFEMVLLGLVNNLRWHVSKEQLKMVGDILEKLNISDISKQPFDTLSGGQKQMVSMAQSLISRPKVLLLDEPTSALDLRHQLIVMDIAQKYTLNTGAVTIFVVHDLGLAARYSSKLLLLDGGNIKAYDVPEKVLKAYLLENVYGVEISIEKTRSGFLSAIPIKPVDNKIGEVS